MVLGTFNARSICNKSSAVLQLLNKNDIDLSLVQETWLKADDRSIIAEIKDHGYDIKSIPRRRRGGGVAVIHKNTISVSCVKQPQFKTFEILECVVKGKHQSSVRLSSIYRTGKKFKEFFKEFANYLDVLSEKLGQPIINGDLNFHVEDPTDQQAKRFLALLNEKGFSQHIKEVTHENGGTLDLPVVITRSADANRLPTPSLKSIAPFNIKAISSNMHCTGSDHYFFKYNISHEIEDTSCTIHSYEYRKFGNINIKKFKEDIKQSKIGNPNEYGTLDNAVLLYESCLQQLIDKHAPKIVGTRKNNGKQWWNSACGEARRTEQRAKRKYVKSKSTINFLQYQNATRNAYRIINKARNIFFEDKFKAESGNIKNTYKIFNHLMNKTYQKTQLPNGDNDEIIANHILSHFKDKVKHIHDNIYKQNIAENYNVQNCIPTSMRHSPLKNKLYVFKPLTNTQIAEIIKSMHVTSCELDQIPTSLLISCLDELLDIISYIANQSIMTGKDPISLKEAIVKPSLKGFNLDSDDLSNYRPISNLKFLSKIIEKCVYIQLIQYLEENNLFASNQSGYRRFHSCETAVTKIHNDILTVIDNNTNVVLLLLDLSAAFDTIDHCLLLNKLSSDFGICGTAHSWFKSYLSDRSFRVQVRNAVSVKALADIGVPQGSILGPILFILYTRDLECIAKKHGYEIHLYADDTQLYTKYLPLQDISHLTSSIEKCMKDIKEWMSVHFLKLNDSKTEVLFIGPKSQKSSTTLMPPVTIDEKVIVPSSFGKTLGVYFDTHMKLEKYISETCKICYLRLRNLRMLGPKLSRKLKVQLVTSLILSKLDYCNNILYGCTASMISRLQKVQNSAVRYIFNLKRRVPTSHYLKYLHFLPVNYRIHYKIALLCFKCLNNFAPEYLKNLIKLRPVCNISLRLDNDYYFLRTPFLSNNSSSFKFSSFSHSGPKIWNTLPYDIRCISSLSDFKHHLKTYLFKKAFD